MKFTLKASGQVTSSYHKTILLGPVCNWTHQTGPVWSNEVSLLLSDLYQSRKLSSNKTSWTEKKSCYFSFIEFSIMFGLELVLNFHIFNFDLRSTLLIQMNVNFSSELIPEIGD